MQEALASADADTPAALVKAVTDALAVRDSEAPVITDRAGNPKPDPDLRDNENVPLPEVSVAYEPDPTARLETIEYRTAVDDYFETEVHPYVPDAWHDPAKTKIGYEDPPNPPLLHLHPTPPPQRNRRRDQGLGSRDPSSTVGNDQMNGRVDPSWVTLPMYVAPSATSTRRRRPMRSRYDS